MFCIEPVWDSGECFLVLWRDFPDGRSCSLGIYGSSEAAWAALRKAVDDPR